ncbi:unnamed protein product [Clonostachys rhizophaga]|uniref:Vegetative incompatibility protein HET-E-1 n=1 Tax=Clonostachys rhizophaga TaxID=160324 RepID=A0A9N9VKH0_9HYPO|nr:unnamed protein product [Clonostachys rhizophaga]
MRLINIETQKLEEFFGDAIPPYAILSHTWGADDEEISFRDIQTGGGNIEKAGYGRIKFEGCCNQAKKDELKYAWIDTCCVDKANAVELSEAINSMFRWYKRAAFCYTYLSDVPPGDNSWDSGSKFFASRWFRRGWTLQELLAPEELHFYNQEWTFIGTKGDMSKEIETITGIPRQFLLGWEDFWDATVAQRMSWAANRGTKREEDIAYCLLGIFGVTMPMIYGEGDQAFIRLQEAIMKHTRDDSILAWGLNAVESVPSNSTDVVSAGILATAPSDFENCGRIVLRKQDALAANTFDISGGRLRVHLPLHAASDGETFGLLHCGPEHDTEQVVGIPLHKAVPGAASDEYLRPQGHHPVLLAKTTSIASPEPIRIQMGRQSRVHKATSRRYWLYINGHQKINAKLNDIYPQLSWVKGRALIAEANDLDGHITRRYLARFRTQGEGSQDIVVALEFEIRGLQVQARHHVMISSRDTALEDLSQKLVYMEREAFGKHSASNGNLNLNVTVKEELFAQQPTFVITLARMSTSPETTINATLELRQVNLKLEFVKTLQEEDQIRQKTEQLKQQRDGTIAALASMKKRLAVVDKELRKQNEEKALLTIEMNELTNRDNEASQLQDELSGQESETQRRLDELDGKLASKDWLGRMIKMLLDTSVSPSKAKSQATKSVTIFSIPRQKLRDKPANRLHDIEFAAEISTSLLAQVRSLQSLLTEKDEELRDSKSEVSRLDTEAESLRQRVKTLDESDQRYKDENWNLETVIHEMKTALKEAAEREKKMAQSLNILQSEGIPTRRELEEIKATNSYLIDDHAAALKHYEIELDSAKRKIAELTGQNQGLAKAFSLQHGRGLDRDVGTSRQLCQTDERPSKRPRAKNDITPSEWESDAR